MSREDAIAYIWGLHRGVAYEVCTSRKERKELEQETREALAALGVSKEEW